MASLKNRPILILGASGQLGRALEHKLGASAQAWSHQDADLSIPEKLPVLLDIMHPGVIFNAAAYTQVDRAEQEEEHAHIINGVAPGIIARWCAEHDVPFVHYSTDYVYSGAGILPWSEDAPGAPINAYGRTKLAGDQAVMAAGGKWLIFRTSWVYDAHGKNFLNTIMRLAQERDILRIIVDQYGAPTYAPDLADASLIILGKAVAMTTFPSGIYHLCNSGETTWYEFATTIIAEMRQYGREVKVRTIEAIPTSSYPTSAPRPLNSRLSLHKIRQTFGIELDHWQNGLQRCLLELKVGSPEK